MVDLEVQEHCNLITNTKTDKETNDKYYIEFPKYHEHLNRSFDSFDNYKKFIDSLKDNTIYNNVYPPIKKIMGKFKDTLMDIIYLNNNEYVYVLTKEWKTIPEHTFEVLGVFKFKEDAIEELNNLYKEDLEWMQETCNCKESELNRNELTDSYSLISKDNIFCINTIQNRILTIN
jgi:hypothetical protein